MFKNLIKEFKEFISRGNVMDLAVGVIMGSAFTSIVKSLVDDVIMPVVGILLGGVDFTNLVLTIPSFFGNGSVTVRYGLCLQNTVNFLIIAACVFGFVKLLNIFQRNKDEQEEVEVKTELGILEEIRDLLKEQNK